MMQITIIHFIIAGIKYLCDQFFCKIGISITDYLLNRLFPMIYIHILPLIFSIQRNLYY